MIPCINIPEDSLTTYTDLDYIIGSPVLDFELVEALRNNCTNSHFTIVLPGSSEDGAELPPEAFTVTNYTEFRQISISLEAASTSTIFGTGNYAFEVWEEDWFTGFIAKTRFEVQVLEPFAGIVAVIV